MKPREAFGDFMESDVRDGEAFFLLGVLCRTAPEEFQQAMLALKTYRLKNGREEQTK